MKRPPRESRGRIIHYFVGWVFWWLGGGGGRKGAVLLGPFPVLCLSSSCARRAFILLRGFVNPKLWPRRALDSYPVQGLGFRV